MSKIQNEDVKTLAQLTGAGGAASQLINDTKIYLTGGGLNKQLSAAITDGDIGTGPLTTKGDLFTRSTVNARLPVGTNGQFLKSDSAETTGLKWSAVDLASVSVTGLLPVANGGSGVATASANTVFAGPISGGAAAPAFRALALVDLPIAVHVHAYNTAGTVLNNGPADVPFATVVSDSYSAYSSPTFTVPTSQGGIYTISYQLSWTGIMNSGQVFQVNLVTTAATIPFGILVYDNANSRAFSIGRTLSLRLAVGDTVKLSVTTTLAGSQTLTTNARENFLSIVKVST